MKLVICMPSFNESRRVCSFLERLENDLGDKWDLHIVLVDDSSTDDTYVRVENLGIDNLTIIRNPSNLGHGPSTVKAISIAIEQDPDLILCADGDGEVEIASLHAMALRLQDPSIQIVEGARESRVEPWFRRITSLATRFIVFQRSGIFPVDSNTPFRAYKPETAKSLLRRLPPKSLVPNLHFSTLTRVLGIRFVSIPVLVQVAENSERGVTWNQKFKLIPSKRFISFCYNASVEWFKFGKNLNKYRHTQNAE